MYEEGPITQDFEGATHLEERSLRERAWVKGRELREASTTNRHLLGLWTVSVGTLVLLVVVLGRRVTTASFIQLYHQLRGTGEDPQAEAGPEDGEPIPVDEIPLERRQVVSFV